jgi:Contractile injection system tube protein
MGSLEKAIISVRDPDPQKDSELKKIEALFNPEKYSIEKSATWEEKGGRKTLQFVGMSRKSFSIDLFFDTYEQGTDVRLHTNEIVQLMEPTVEYRGKKVPPISVFSWGGFNFRGIVEKVTQSFSLFLSSGIPVRAVLNVAFKQFSYAEEQARGSPPGDPTKARRVKEGETLNGIAAQEYGDPALWRVIADSNPDVITNPRVLEAGTLLVIPALVK